MMLISIVLYELVSIVLPVFLKYQKFDQGCEACQTSEV